jgi:uncharacterized protein YpmB
VGDRDKQVLEDKRIVLVSAPDLKMIQTVAKDGVTHDKAYPFVEDSKHAFPW